MSALSRESGGFRQAVRLTSHRIAGADVRRVRRRVMSVMAAHVMSDSLISGKRS